ncbi:MAG: glycosyltransferase [Bacilli bacterium]|nr:glycosyltransferase [Bacilli bacterium]
MISNEKILVYGNFMYRSSGYGGQITKTRNVFRCLVEKYGEESVSEFNMENWNKNPIGTILRLSKSIKQTHHLVVLPGDNNLKFLLVFLRKYLRSKQLKVYYMVVGGWLYDYLKNKKKKIEVISRFTGIFVETLDLVSKLKSLGLKNVFYSPVFSLREPLEEIKINNDIEAIKKKDTFSFCTFSRVLKEKGVGDAADAIQILNDRIGICCHLDIYGAIDKNYKKEFESLLATNKYISYKGFIEDSSVLSTLSAYHCLIFATYYYGEGFPAALLEANMAGLPIIASDWKYNNEIVIDGKTGLLFAPRNIEDMVQKLCVFMDDKKYLDNARIECWKHSWDFTPEKALAPLFEKIEKCGD